MSSDSARKKPILARKLLYTVGSGFALSLVLLALLAYLGLRELAASDARLKRIVQEYTTKTELAYRLRDILRDRAIAMLSIVVMNDPFEKDQEMLRFYALGEAYQTTRFSLQPMLRLEDEKAVLRRIDALTGQNQPLMVQTIELAMDGYTFMAFDLLQREGIPLQRQLVVEIDNLVAIQRHSMRKAHAEANAAYERTRALMFMLGLSAALVAAVVAAAVIHRSGRLALEIEQARAKFQTLFETNTDGIVIMDEHGFTDCNPATLEMFRMTSVREFIGRSPESLGAPIQANGESAGRLARRHIQEAIERGHSVFQWLGRRDDGSLFPAEIALHAMYLDGRPLIQAIIRDVTLQQAAKDALQAAHDAALAAANMKSRFVANVSHEIRTPMNGILGMTRLLLNSELNPTQRAWAESVAQSGEALLRIINDLLDFSKIEAGGMTLEETVFDLESLVRDIVELYRPRVSAKALEFRLEIDLAAPSWVRGDPLRVRQILLNLLDNAIKFTAEGHIGLRVERMEAGTERLRYRFSIEDSGIGIPAETLPHIFQAFSQADGSISRKFGGTGLGLAICRQLADLMGGSLNVVSQPGQGSVFTLELPLMSADAPAETPPAPRPLPRFKPARVLVAEDNAINQMLTRTLLENLGLSVTLAGDGRAAFESLRDAPPDLVLMDCQMPEWDGFTATRAIRAWEAEQGRARIPILALTAHAMPGYDQVCREAGMDDYLSKPLDEAMLASALAVWLPDWVCDENEALSAPLTSPPRAQKELRLERLERLCRSNPAQLREMLELFLSSTAPLVQEMGVALGEASHAQAARLAHQIKGAATYVGAETLVAAAAAAERAGKKGDGPALKAAHAALADAFENLRREIEDMLQKPL